jgi:hypothetical protein
VSEAPRIPQEFSGRHPDTIEKLRWLIPNPHLPDGALKVSALFHALGAELIRELNDGPQLTIALQRLIDAKDAAVRQAIADDEA